jgi:hypothetical protein
MLVAGFDIQLMVSQISERTCRPSASCTLFIVVAIQSRVVIRSERVEHTKSRLLRLCGITVNYVLWKYLNRMKLSVQLGRNAIR